MAAITCKALTWAYKETTYLHDVDLEVKEGALFGLLGEDGSGKTTLLKLITGLLKPTSGTCTLFESDSSDPVQALDRVGCLVGEPAFYPQFTAKENLKLFSFLSGGDVADVMEKTGITFGSIPVQYLTLSMKKLLGLSLALLGSPRLLLLDEPFAVDASTRPRVRDLLTAEAENATVFFTTSDPQVIKDTAKEAALLKEGTIEAEGKAKTVAGMEVKK